MSISHRSILTVYFETINHYIFSFGRTLETVDLSSNFIATIFDTFLSSPLERAAFLLISALFRRGNIQR